MSRTPSPRLNPWLALLLWCSSVAAAETPLRSVSLQLPWKHQFEFAGHYAAIQQGYYARRGLQVELREYQEGQDVIGEVVAGRAEFGLINSSLIQARLEGQPVKLLANYFKRMPLVILARPDIKRLSDLRGRRLMIDPKDLQSPLMRLAFETEGLIPGQNLTIVPHSFDATPLLRGEVDAHDRLLLQRALLSGSAGF
jgi:ABC-type nitrate/sulfonate/bicarbonate transport system substrate-binding protein